MFPRGGKTFALAPQAVGGSLWVEMVEGSGERGLGKAEHDAALTRTSVYVKIQYVMHLAKPVPPGTRCADFIAPKGAVRKCISLQEQGGSGGNPKDRTGFGAGYAILGLIGWANVKHSV